MADFVTHNRNQGTRRSSLDGRPSASPAAADPFDLRVRKWLLAAHRSFRSWTAVAAAFGISSKGKAQHIAEGRAAVTPELRRQYAELASYRKAGRWLAGRLK